MTQSFLFAQNLWIKGLIDRKDEPVTYGFGLAVDNFEQAVELVNNITEEEYHQMREKVAGVSYLLRNGFFTKRLLTEAVFKAQMGN